jgi:hypothetical protein
LSRLRLGSSRRGGGSDSGCGRGSGRFAEESVEGISHRTHFDGTRSGPSSRLKVPSTATENTTAIKKARERKRVRGDGKRRKTKPRRIIVKRIIIFLFLLPETARKLRMRDRWRQQIQSTVAWFRRRGRRTIAGVLAQTVHSIDTFLKN